MRCDMCYMWDLCVTCAILGVTCVFYVLHAVMQFNMHHMYNFMCHMFAFVSHMQFDMCYMCDLCATCVVLVSHVLS